MDSDLGLLQRLINHKLWPTYAAERLRLKEIAAQARLQGTTAGSLAYILVTNQIVEEDAQILLREAWMAEDLCLVVRGFGLGSRSTSREKRIKGLMFGRLLSELDEQVDCKGKTEFIYAARNERTTKQDNPPLGDCVRRDRHLWSHHLI